ncbi:hypothetical protein RvY_11587 [Ramazzottius varieornatus]|uniref:Uncharacterized protein n=1 Tax=Ramazzottius varieornatus TaxID=947166 RepID=A0A1D1VGK8_RAMVA|nr:hypothetical protein RvY_11587 [Ramazzottius varieornatus]
MPAADWHFHMAQVTGVTAECEGTSGKVDQSLLSYEKEFCLDARNPRVLTWAEVSASDFRTCERAYSQSARHCSRSALMISAIRIQLLTT